MESSVLIAEADKDTHLLSCCSFCFLSSPSGKNSRVNLQEQNILARQISEKVLLFVQSVHKVTSSHFHCLWVRLLHSDQAPLNSIRPTVSIWFLCKYSKT